MKDRAMLEAAAKAAGIEVIEHRSGGLPWTVRRGGLLVPWNPLTDDGDSLRMLIKLRMSLVPLEGGGWDVYQYHEESCEEVLLATDADPCYAITRAAAKLGGWQE